MMTDDMGSGSSSGEPQGTTSHQDMIVKICGPIDATLKCLNAIKGTCPNEYHGATTTLMVASSDPNSDGPTLDTYKMFIDKVCPSLPPSFATNTCIKEKFNDPKLRQCLEDVKDESISPQSCAAHRASMKCLYTVMGQCGKKEADVMVKSSSMLMPNVPKNCPVTYDDPEGAASGLVISIATLIISSLLALI